MLNVPTGQKGEQKKTCTCKTIKISRPWRKIYKALKHFSLKNYRWDIFFTKEQDTTETVQLQKKMSFIKTYTHPTFNLRAFRLYTPSLVALQI